MTDEQTFKEKHPLSCVYWIHVHGLHTNPFNEGYVGVSIHGWKARFKNHVWAAQKMSNLKVHRAMRKYGDAIVCKEIFLGNAEDCLGVEKALRPEHGMRGVWNITVGGIRSGMAEGGFSDEAKRKVSHANKGRIPSKCTREKMRVAQTGRKHSAESRTKISESNMGKTHTTESKQKMALSWNVGRDWEHPRANTDTWSTALDIQVYMEQNPTHGCERVVMSAGLPRATSPTLYKKIKSGWNPSEDTDYLTWLSQYKQKECNESTLAT